MHVAKVSKKYVTQSGPRESVSYLLRRTYRDGGKVKHETLANLSALPPATLQAVQASCRPCPPSPSPPPRNAVRSSSCTPPFPSP